MSIKTLKKGLAGLAIAAAGFAFAGTAIAADLDYDEYRDGRYKDRSYIDKTLDEYERRTGQYQKHHYQDEGHQDKRHGNKWGNKWGDRYENGYGNNACLHPRQIRRQLIKRGWHDFEVLRERPRRIVMQATNYNGRRFRIVVDKCDAQIVRRHPIRRYWGWNNRNH